MRRKLAAGNWKMNGTGAELDALSAMIDALPGTNVVEPEVLKPIEF